jgi:hypothetical protein
MAVHMRYHARRQVELRHGCSLRRLRRETELGFSGFGGGGSGEKESYGFQGSGVAARGGEGDTVTERRCGKYSSDSPRPWAGHRAH